MIRAARISDLRARAAARDREDVRCRDHVSGGRRGRAARDLDAAGPRDFCGHSRHPRRRRRPSICHQELPGSANRELRNRGRARGVEQISRRVGGQRRAAACDRERRLGGEHTRRRVDGAR